MGKFLESIKGYAQRGDEKKMWKSIELLDEQMCKLEESNPDDFWKIMRDIHEINCGPHYDEVFSKYDVSEMFHKNASGETIKGEHWGITQVKDAIKPYANKISSLYNIYDAYVALNANWHDKVVRWKNKFPNSFEEEIIDDAICFYMLDDDAPDGKIWRYIQAMDENC